MSKIVKEQDSLFYREFVKADKLMLLLLFLQWFIATFISAIPYNTHLFGFINGGLMFLIPALMYPFFKGSRLLRMTIAISMMVFSAIFIQQHLGRIEMHFHIFVAIAFLAFYKDVAPVLLATFTTIIYHLLGNYLQALDTRVFDIPLMVFNYGCGWDIVLLHGFFALTEGVVVGYMVKKQIDYSLDLYRSEQKTKKLHDELIAEHKMNIKLHTETRQLQVALDENSIVSRTDPRGIITYANDKFVKISGYSQDELIGASHNIIRHPDVSKTFFKKLWEKIRAKEVFRATFKNRAKDGSDYYIDTTIIPLVDEEGEITEYLSVRYDVSELVATKNALVGEQAKDRFLANMSHELRTPLNAMIGFITLANKEKNNDKVKEYLDISLQNSNQLLCLINDILDISKMKSGKFSLEYAPFSPHHSLENLVMNFKGTILKKALNFSLVLDPSLEIVLWGDWQRIAQILTNLLSNAIKFTPEKGDVTLKAKYENGHLFCSVIDTGIGLTPESQDKIFGEFEQADTSTTRKYGGTGLGLSISSELAVMMKGTLSVESKENEGSIFTLTVPLRESNTLLIADKQLSVENTIVTFEGHVLVAEDNKTNQILIKIMLEELGITCDIANDGVEAVSMFSPDKHALILMDENMPNMGGIEAMQELRKKYTVTVIALTANTMKGDKERFLKAGMDDFIGKPVKNEALIPILEKYLKSEF